MELNFIANSSLISKESLLKAFFSIKHPLKLLVIETIFHKNIFLTVLVKKYPLRFYIYAYYESLFVYYWRVQKFICLYSLITRVKDGLVFFVDFAYEKQN